MHGGRGTSTTTAYVIECRSCGEKLEDLPSNGSGRSRDAVAEWNRYRRLPKGAAMTRPDAPRPGDPVTPPAEGVEARDRNGDRRDQWSARIDAAHPMNTGNHKAYMQAMDMVGNRNSKAELVNLVCWLLQGQP